MVVSLLVFSATRLIFVFLSFRGLDSDVEYNIYPITRAMPTCANYAVTAYLAFSILPCETQALPTSEDELMARDDETQKLRDKADRTGG